MLLGRAQVDAPKKLIIQGFNPIGQPRFWHSRGVESDGKQAPWVGRTIEDGNELAKTRIKCLDRSTTRNLPGVALTQFKTPNGLPTMVLGPK